MFDALKTDSSIKGDGDFLGGFILDSDVYHMAIDLAYLEIASSGAMGLALHTKDSNGKANKSMLWMTSGRDKGCLNYFINGKGEKNYLPGFTLANSICQLSIGKEISTLTTDEKVVSLYNFDQKKDVPTKKQVFTELLGAEISLGIIKQIVDKTAKQADNTYAPTGETREENEIDKAFRTRDHMTAAEIIAQAEAPVFMGKWLEKNKGTVRNKAKGVTGTVGTAGAIAANAAAPEKKSLFA